MTVDSLVLEDDPAVLRAVVDAFGREGWNVRSATDGPTGLARAREHRPEIVVCDVGLPGPSGLEVMQTLQN
jgi:CheY-like chemotaxis protein